MASLHLCLIQSISMSLIKDTKRTFIGPHILISIANFIRLAVRHNETCHLNFQIKNV
jgi:hypothetical protein